MKTRKSIQGEVEVQASGCCSTPATKVESNDPCCEQPTDDSSCCDKSEAKEVNAKQAGCC